MALSVILSLSIFVKTKYRLRILQIYEILLKKQYWNMRIYCKIN